jgi:hypothetical protein
MDGCILIITEKKPHLEGKVREYLKQKNTEIWVELIEKDEAGLTKQGYGKVQMSMDWTT